MAKESNKRQEITNKKLSSPESDERKSGMLGTKLDADEKIDLRKKIVITRNRKTSKRRIQLSRFKRRILKHTKLLRLGLTLAIITAIIFVMFSVVLFIARTFAGSYFELANDFIFTPDEKVRTIGEKTNILILGKSGAGHEAPDLTDTIIFVSVSYTEKSISLISLPRDIWITDLRAKLNSMYYWGNEKQSLVDGKTEEDISGGLILAKSEVERIVGQPVQYGVVIDFSGFREVIDALGGVGVDVERSFVDTKFPVEGREDDDCGGGDPEYLCRYETISFREGVQHMDGETALKFVRSRNAEGDEGTDFARSARQQRVISAIADKTLSREILLHPRKWFELRDIALKYTETDLDNPAMAILARRAFQSRDNISSHVLPETLLENPPKSPKYDNLYVFIPKGGNWEEIRRWVEDILP